MFLSPDKDCRFGASFLSLAVRYGIVNFVEAKANQGCLVQDSDNKVWPLLLDAIRVDSQWQTYCHDTVPHLEMITCMLKKGADPNFLIPHYDKVSVWDKTLEPILEAFDGKNIKSPWNTIARVMIEHKANVNKDRIRKLLPSEYPASYVVVLFQELSAIQQATKKRRSPWRLWG